MPTLDIHGKIAASQIAFYTLVAALTIALLQIARISEAALILAAELVQHPNLNLIIAALGIQAAALAPLLLSTIGFLGMAGQSTYSEISRVSLIFRLTGLVTLAGLALSIAGGVLGSQLSPSKRSTGLILRRASTGVFAAVYVVLFLAHFGCWTYHFQMRNYRLRLLGGATLALPFLGVRVAYAILAAWSASDLFGNLLSSNPNLAKFNSVNGQMVTYLVMSVVMEFVVAALYVLFSTVLSRRHSR
ncbi:hypothetical protein C0995_014176 [Termitomyces sp. Mi166|nr:hypothetical protein C0995_014176 [Termitomyces sp. Mi166\